MLKVLSLEIIRRLPVIYRFVIRRDISNDILHITVEDSTQIVERFSGYMLIVFEPKNGGRGQTMLFTESIPILISLLKELPERSIVDHHPSPIETFLSVKTSIGCIPRVEYLRKNEYNRKLVW